MNDLTPLFDYCAHCRIRGYHVDTSAGEICDAGEVVAYAPSEHPWLMVSKQGELLCKDCASGTE